MNRILHLGFVVEFLDNTASDGPAKNACTELIHRSQDCAPWRIQSSYVFVQDDIREDQGPAQTRLGLE
jgi:hypothetical protein